LRELFQEFSRASSATASKYGGTAASDWAASRLAIAIERVAEALLAEDEPVPQNGPGIVRAHGVMRP
jgi:hypothetical protein